MSPGPSSEVSDQPGSFPGPSREHRHKPGGVALQGYGSKFELGLFTRHSTPRTEKLSPAPRLKLPERRENLRIIPRAESCRFAVSDQRFENVEGLSQSRAHR